MSWGQGQGGWGQQGQQGQGQGGWGQQGQGQGQGGWGQQNHGQWGQQGQQGQQGVVQPGFGQQIGWGQGQQGQQGFGQGQQGGWGQGQGQGQQGQQGGWGQGQQGGFQNQGEFNPVPNQLYKIVSVQNQHFSLDCSGNPLQRRKLILYSFHGGQNQKFKFVPDTQGFYSLINNENGGTLQYPDGNGTQGVQLHISQPNNTPNQKWLIKRNNNGFAILSAYKPNLALDIEGGVINNQTRIILWPFGNKKNQTWQIIPA